VLMAAGTPAGMADVLLGLGLPGVVVLALGLVVRVLYNRAQEDAAYHRSRADRLEEEVRALNAAVRTEYVTTIAKATDAISDALTSLDSLRRG
jgi:hypothetical protein